MGRSSRAVRGAGGPRCLRRLCSPDSHGLPCLTLASGPPCPLQLGSTAIAVRTDEGVVLAVEKRVTSPLLVRASPGCRLLVGGFRGPACAVPCPTHAGGGTLHLVPQCAAGEGDALHCTAAKPEPAFARAPSSAVAPSSACRSLAA